MKDSTSSNIIIFERKPVILFFSVIDLKTLKFEVNRRHLLRTAWSGSNRCCSLLLLNLSEITCFISKCQRAIKSFHTYLYYRWHSLTTSWCLSSLPHFYLFRNILYCKNILCVMKVGERFPPATRTLTLSWHRATDFVLTAGCWLHISPYWKCDFRS